MFGSNKPTMILEFDGIGKKVPLRSEDLYPPLKSMGCHWQSQKRATRDMFRDAMIGLTPDEIMLELIEHLAGRPDVCGTILEKHSNDLRRLAWKIQRGEA